MNVELSTVNLWSQIYHVPVETAEELIKRVMKDYDHLSGLCTEKCFTCLHFDQSLIGYGCYKDYENCEIWYFRIGEKNL